MFSDTNHRGEKSLSTSQKIELKMSAINSPAWLGTLRTYVVLVTLLNLCWEILQLPLYTIWSTGSHRDIVFALLHCTAGDVLIAVCSLVFSLLMAGRQEWPDSRFKTIALITIQLGLGYTVYSEWHNTTVTQSWAYSAAMPRLFGIGLAPVAQWLFVPGFVFWWIYRRLPVGQSTIFGSRSLK